jgi:sugar O-acyltransferase (sialic acid O-acetyltransferase NeuD family)
MTRTTGNRIVILGGGGFGTFARDLCEFTGNDPVGILDNFKAKGTKVNGCPVLGSTDLISDPDLRQTCEFVIAIRDFKLRRDWAEQVRSSGGRLASLIHPSVVISPSAMLGEGIMINAFSFVYANAKVGDLCLIESHCMIGTEIVIGEACMLAPGVHINRQSRVGEDTFVGSCAVLSTNVTVGRNCVIGCGAAVVRDIPDDKVAAGVPARILHDNVTRSSH